MHATRTSCEGEARETHVRFGRRNGAQPAFYSEIFLRGFNLRVLQQRGQLPKFLQQTSNTVGLTAPRALTAMRVCTVHYGSSDALRPPGKGRRGRASGNCGGSVPASSSAHSLRGCRGARRVARYSGLSRSGVLWPSPSLRSSQCNPNRTIPNILDVGGTGETRNRQPSNGRGW